MTEPDPTAFVREALLELKGSHDARPWPERRKLAAQLNQFLGKWAPTEQVLELAYLLAHDPKPEVRKEIAEVMVRLPDEWFMKLAVKLGADENAFVKSAAERALTRRRRTSEESQRAVRKLGAVRNRLDSFEQTYGPTATKQVRRIADEQFSALVRETHHDIRNILSPVKTSIRSILRHFEHGKPDEKTCVQRLHEMKQCMDYLDRFLGDMKEYCRVTSTRQRRERLADVVEEAENMARTAVTEAGTDLSTVEIAKDVPEALTVWVARHQVLMAVVHVIRNAYESFFMQPLKRKKRHVRIKARSLDAGNVSLVIADNGPGIHEDDLERLREFAPAKTTWKVGGTGFGLPTAARYVKAQGGDLLIDSKLGKGTTVTLVLPVDGEDA